MMAAQYKSADQCRKVRWSPFLIWVFPSVVVFAGCDLLSTNPEYQLLLSLSDVKHVVWTLESQSQNGTQLDLSSFEPFNLIFNQTEFFGDDGCNFYGAKYTIESDRIVPDEVAITDQLCDLQSWPVDHLVEEFRISITETELKIFALNSTFVYKSNFSSGIEDSPLLARQWQLASSNDPELADINAPVVRPTLLFERDRTFKITWKCDQDNLFGCNQIPGLFGVGEAQTIQFYPRGSQVFGTQGLDRVERILGSSSYALENESLILRNGASIFEFTKLSNDHRMFIESYSATQENHGRNIDSANHVEGGLGIRASKAD